ncbi:MAG: HAD family hydrolase [Fusicatenibacter sp.]|nr:HAD family hydrolase [Fusicatenibacter sp.]
MHQNYIFDLYGTLVDIHTNEQKAYLWKKMACFYGMKGASYEHREMKKRYHELVREKEKEALNRCGRESGAPEIQIGEVFRQMYEEKGVCVSDEEIADTARIFRAISLERLTLFEGTAELLDAIHAAGKKAYLLSNAQALFTAPEIRMLGLDQKLDGILLSSDAGVKKPDPEFYRMLLESYHLSPVESVMTGNDDQADCHGASAVGMDSIYICTEQSPKRTKPLPENCREIHRILQVLER